VRSARSSLYFRGSGPRRDDIAGAPSRLTGFRIKISDSFAKFVGHWRHDAGRGFAQGALLGFVLELQFPVDGGPGGDANYG
jgi:hypothetical protein